MPCLKVHAIGYVQHNAVLKAFEWLISKNLHVSADMYTDRLLQDTLRKCLQSADGFNSSLAFEIMQSQSQPLGL